MHSHREGWCYFCIRFVGPVSLREKTAQPQSLIALPRMKNCITKYCELFRQKDSQKETFHKLFKGQVEVIDRDDRPPRARVWATKVKLPLQTRDGSFDPELQLLQSSQKYLPSIPENGTNL